MIEENLIEGSAFIVSARELQAALGNTIQHGMWIVRAIKVA